MFLTRTPLIKVRIFKKYVGRIILEFAYFNNSSAILNLVAMGGFA